MPSVNTTSTSDISMSEPSQEELLSQDIQSKLKISNGIDSLSKEILKEGCEKEVVRLGKGILRESSQKDIDSTEKQLNPPEVKVKVRNDLDGSNLFTDGQHLCSAAQAIASILASMQPTMSVREAIQRCHKLEAQLEAERETVSRLRDQLASSEKMLAELREIHSKCPSATSINDLPEELMIEIFSYLPTDCLIFVISKVCLYWKRLTEDSGLWAKISIEKDFNKLIRTLHHAPCLQHATIQSEYLSVHDDDEDEYFKVLTTTQCRIRSLTLPDFEPIAVRMLRQQAALGAYLKHVHINSWWDNERKHYRGEIWHALAALDMVSITLHEFDGGNSYFHSAFRPHKGQFANVRHLDLYCKVVPGGLLPALLENCRASLQTVSLPPKTKGEVVVMLGDCPLLREANVPFLGDVVALEKNDCLDFIELNAEWMPADVVRCQIPDVMRFLHMPSVTQRLRTLFFQGMPVECRELLRAVCKVKNLNFVRIHNIVETEAADLLPRMLNRLANLERFTIAALPPPNVIDNIPFDACAGLVELTLIGACHDDETGCRIPAVMRLLHHRPGLHVFLDLGLGVRGHLEGLYPLCLRYHRLVCEDESLWHRFYPVMTNHPSDKCAWCLHHREPYATIVDMQGKLAGLIPHFNGDNDDEE